MDERTLARRLELAHEQSPELPITIERGSREDLLALQRFHYAPGTPATLDLVLLATFEGERAGVLAVSRSVLNGVWREIAWPGRFTTGDRRQDARAINTNLRCISRVIVEPRFRGLSIARRLVGAYLESPLTPATESIAAMGAYCPFFERGGMARIDPDPTQRDRRLLDVLDAHGLGVLDLVRTDLSGPIERGLRVWARASRSTRSRAGASVGELSWLAACRLVRPRRVFVHGVGDWEPSYLGGLDG